MASIKAALAALQADGLKLGPAWDAAHALAQSREGEAAYDRLHAFLHRVEGDAANAAYWYRQSGEPAFTGDLAAECAELVARHGRPGAAG